MQARVDDMVRSGLSVPGAVIPKHRAKDGAGLDSNELGQLEVVEVGSTTSIRIVAASSGATI